MAIPTVILDFMAAHELSGTPDEMTICGTAGVRVRLGDLRALINAAYEAQNPPAAVTTTRTGPRLSPNDEAPGRRAPRP